MTTDPTPLQERIARELYARGNDELRKAWDNPRNLHQVPQWREKYRELSAAALPLIAAEVRKAKAEALGEAVEKYAITIPDALGYKVPAVTVEDLLEAADEYETGDSDEHR